MWTVFWSVGEWFSYELGPWAIETGAKLWRSFLDYVLSGEMVSDIAGGWGAVIEWIETDAASWIADGARGLWTGIVNEFVVAINSIIGIWNGLSFDIPSIDAFGVTIGGQTVNTPDISTIQRSYGPSTGATSNTPTVKRFAEGGVVTRPTFALIGEDARTTPEIVAPEDTIRRIVREESGRGGGRQPIQLVVDRRVLAEVVVDVMNQHMKKAS